MMAKNEASPTAKKRPWNAARVAPSKATKRAANDNHPQPKEWRLQAAAVRRLRSLPEHGALFLVAGDMNAAKRGPQAAVQAQATGMTPGEPDLRVYLPGGTVRFIEYKTARGRLSPEQRQRHADLARLGHVVEVVKAATETECADRTEALVRGWIANLQTPTSILSA